MLWGERTSKIIVLKIDDPDDFLYHHILSLLSSQETIIETVIEGSIIFVTPDFTVYLDQHRVFSKVSEIILTRKVYDILLYFYKTQVVSSALLKSMNTSGKSRTMV